MLNYRRVDHWWSLESTIIDRNISIDDIDHKLLIDDQLLLMIFEYIWYTDDILINGGFRQVMGVPVIIQTSDLQSSMATWLGNSRSRNASINGKKIYQMSSKPFFFARGIQILFVNDNDKEGWH